MNQVLIFGGAGFIGSNLVSLLAEKNVRVVVFDNLSMGNQIRDGIEHDLVVGDMTDFEAVKSVIYRENPDTIYHLVANSDISSSSENPNLDLDNTLLSTVTLCAALREINWQGNQLVFASSSAVYRESTSECSEDSATVPVSSYGWMKLASERIMRSYAEQVGDKKLIIARFPNVTGVHQTHGVVFDLVRKLKNDNKTLTVLGNGSQEKPYMLASQLTESLDHVLGQVWEGVVIANFGPESTTSVKRIVETIVSVSGLEPDVMFGTTDYGWVGDVPKYRLNTTLVQERFGTRPFASSDDAIRESVRWAWDNL